MQKKPNLPHPQYFEGVQFGLMLAAHWVEKRISNFHPEITEEQKADLVDGLLELAVFSEGFVEEGQK